jgi:predicted phosphodiesterase
MNFKILLRTAIVFLCISLVQHHHVHAEKLKITHGPYLVEPAENSITIIWFTNKGCVSWIEYCGDQNFGTFPSWGGYPQIAKSSHNGLIDANSKMHSIRIDNLTAGTKYRYRIVSKEILQYDPYEVIFGDSVVDEILDFETLDPDKRSFSFGVVTDLHERALMLDTLLQVAPTDSLDMMFFTGDMLNWIGSEDRIFNGFLDVSVDHFAKEKPFILIRGNHETRGTNARMLFDYFPHSSGKFYYAFSQGSVRFIVLDSGEDKSDSHPVYAGLVDFDQYRTEQSDWLKQEVQSEEFKKAKYKIVFIHIPPFTGSRGHGSNDITEKWGEILNESNIDIVISGHHHRFSKMDPVEGKNQFPVLIVGKDMILKTDVSDKDLIFSVKNKDDEVVDEFSIDAKNR